MMGGSSDSDVLPTSRHEYTNRAFVLGITGKRTLGRGARRAFTPHSIRIALLPNPPKIVGNEFNYVAD